MLFATCLLLLAACDQGAAMTASAALATPRVDTMPGTPSSTLVVTGTIATHPDSFTLEYTVENRASDDAYVMDISHVIRGQTADVAVQPIYLAWIGGATAHLVQGVAPLPPDRDVTVSMIPLASRVPPKTKLTRVLTLPRPLAEFGPYDQPAGARADVRRVTELVVTVVALRPSAKGFAVRAIDNHPDVFHVRSDYTMGHVERASTTLALPDRTMLRTYRFAGYPTFTRVK